MYKMEKYYWDGVSVCGMCTPHMIWWSGFHKLTGAVHYAK